ncbi:MAG: Bax inhibitor-1/YccA family protein [Flavobacteriaceae bacterium]|nr:Bax inhibitor-1/YccA family protein [Flavobacteriaceae bacterium]
MNRHLSFRSGNPVLSNKTFIASSDISNRMTMNGTVNKTLLSLFLLMVSGYYMFTEPNIAIMAFSGIGAFIFAIVTIFKKTWAPITVPIYAILEGCLLGGISYMYNSLYEGIVSNAIQLTVGILLALLLAYKSGYIKATENFKLGVFAATGGIFIIYIINFVMSLFGINMPVMDINNSSGFSIGFSIFVVVIASLNLVLDFDFIEEGVEKGAPKYMEWYGAFGLMITLVWLYLEILRLLAKLYSRR